MINKKNLRTSKGSGVKHWLRIAAGVVIPADKQGAYCARQYVYSIGIKHAFEASCGGKGENRPLG